MTKYFNKSEGLQISNLLMSKDGENIKLAISLITTHRKYKNFKKEIAYRFNNYKRTLEDEFKWVKRLNQTNYSVFEIHFQILNNFVLKRTKGIKYFKSQIYRINTFYEYSLLTFVGRCESKIKLNQMRPPKIANYGYFDIGDVVIDNTEKVFVLTTSGWENLTK